MTFDFFIANLALVSDALNWGFRFGVLDSIRVLGFGRRRRWVAMFFPGSAHVAAGPLNPPTLRGVWGGVGEIRVVDGGLRDIEVWGPAAGWVS